MTAAPSERALVLRRVVRLQRAVLGPFIWLWWRVIGVQVAALVVGALAGWQSESLPDALLVTAVIGLGGSAIVLRRLTDRTFRRALELYHDHDCHERWEWQRDTGTKMPRSAAAVRHWLLAHPTGPGRPAALVATGDLEAAGRALDEVAPKTPDDVFAKQLFREQIELMAGRVPEVGPLHTAWPGLPDDGEKRHQRECLGILDAMIAAEHGQDPAVVSPRLPAGRGPDGHHLRHRRVRLRPRSRGDHVTRHRE